MSYGMDLFSFVQQVYYAQEKVLLDFYSTDDKYREVITEGNLVLQELQEAEDWLWLRERLELGPMNMLPGNPIPEFQLPDWVYKVSTLHDDCVRLYDYHFDYDGEPHINEWNYIEVPIVSGGAIHHLHEKPFNQISAVHTPTKPLGAVVYGDTLTFNRPLLPHEANRIAVVDVQRRMEPMHVCDETCTTGKKVCPKAKEKYFLEIPDPNYMVIKTAAMHAAGSPPAAPRAMDLNDQAQKILSAMRTNNAASTTSDFIDWDEPGYLMAY